jgi:hypothetical protein
MTLHTYRSRFNVIGTYLWRLQDEINRRGVNKPSSNHRVKDPHDVVLSSTIYQPSAPCTGPRRVVFSGRSNTCIITGRNVLLGLEGVNLSLYVCESVSMCVCVGVGGGGTRECVRECANGHVQTNEHLIGKC